MKKYQHMGHTLNCYIYLFKFTSFISNITLKGFSSFFLQLHHLLPIFGSLGSRTLGYI